VHNTFRLVANAVPGLIVTDWVAQVVLLDLDA